MGRSKSIFVARRVQIRLSAKDAEIFDRYTAEQISEIMHVAVNTIAPNSSLGAGGVISILRPKSALTETIARISYCKEQINIFFPEKIDEFKSVVKGQCRYAWDTWRWARKVTEKTALDRIAEVAYRLLDAGFIVQVEYSEVVKKIAANSFIPEPLHVVKVIDCGIYQDWFTFVYPKGEEWYNEIMKLTAARYDSGSILVPPEHFAEVEDFAECNSFYLSAEAFKVAQKWREVRNIQQLIELKPSQRTGRKKKRKAETEVNIPAALIDD